MSFNPNIKTLFRDDLDLVVLIPTGDDVYELHRIYHENNNEGENKYLFSVTKEELISMATNIIKYFEETNTKIVSINKGD